jgi:hypothetical protein
VTDSPDIEPASETSDGDDDLRHHVSVDSDEDRVVKTAPSVPEPTLEMPDPAPEGEDKAETTPPLGDFGGPDDASDEQPMLVVDATLPASVSDLGSVLTEPEPPPTELQSAYDCLEIRTPIEELKTFARARLETLVRLGDADRAEVCKAALEEGLSALRDVMGSVRKEAP